MLLQSVNGLEFNTVQLAKILSDCFQNYTVPFSVTAEHFSQRFSAENLNLLLSKIWFDAGTPVAIALVARRGNSARLAAFAVHPFYRGQGIARACMAELCDDLRHAGIEQLSLEVIATNDAGVALYQGLGFQRTDYLFGFRSAIQPVANPIPAMEPVDPLQVSRHIIADGCPALPWLMSPESLYSLPGEGWCHDHHGWAMVAEWGFGPQLRMLYVDTAARHQGRGHRLLRALAQRFPGITTPVAVPERTRALFLDAGFQEQPVVQFLMEKSLD